MIVGGNSISSNDQQKEMKVLEEQSDAAIESKDGQVSTPGTPN